MLPEYGIVGNALKWLLEENILIVGSGFSFHNMREFSFGTSDKPEHRNDEFQEWLIEVCTGKLAKSER
ncbi:MAG: hypothetical protein JW863_16540 [Chitinispirillaceae bacterium]|nr:hypothetical protein [Chitinispirillaceae bacterium]